MKKLTHLEFIQKLRQKRGAQIIGIISHTEPKVIKKNNPPFRALTKTSHLTVVTGASYLNALEKQGARDFKPEGLPYGSMEVPNKIIKTAKGDLQLRTMFRNAPKPISVEYIADGKTVSKDFVKQFLPERQDSQKQEDAGLYGRRQVKVRNFSLNNISQVRMDKEIYRLIPG